jgi:RNA polymerase sigma-70 factor (ECF subfamily)
MSTLRLKTPAQMSKENTPSPGLFPATQWTRIQRAGSSSADLAAEALEEICKAYWYPTFVTARTKHRLDHHQAEDMTQGFWAWMIEKEVIRQADPERGKFRSFLLTCFDRFIGHEWRKDGAKKRGARAPHISIQSDEWNERYEREMGAFASPDEHLSRVWEDATLEAAFAEVEQRWAAKGRASLFRALKVHLTSGAERGTFSGIAEAHGISEENARQHLSRLRKELKEAASRWREGD